MYIDTHCHISKEDYDDIDLIIKDNIASGVNKMIISGCSLDSIYEAIALGKKYNCLYLTLGFHPSEASLIGDKELKILKSFLTNSNVVGLGEIGLDYYYGKNDVKQQKKLFEEQLKLAEELNLPVVIHSRDATQDTIDILRKYNVKGVIHCFSGSVETANIYIKMGFLLGIGGVLTFKNSNLYKVVENVGLDNIVLETDSPYLTPVPYRGTKNSSKYIPIIAEKVAEILNDKVENVEIITTNNAIHMFDLD